MYVLNPQSIETDCFSLVNSQGIVPSLHDPRMIHIQKKKINTTELTAMYGSCSSSFHVHNVHDTEVKVSNDSL
jgi:hypothetical protein